MPLTYYDYGYHPFIRLAYLPAYYADMGSCPLNCGHEGDSEYIMVDVSYDANTGRFMTRGVFLSAHCGTHDPFLRSAPDCRGYTPDFFSYVGGVDRGAPIVWVANGANANYPSLSRCDSGTEDFFDRVGVFGGWLSGQTDTTPYGRILRQFGFFPQTSGGPTPGCSASGVCYQ